MSARWPIYDCYSLASLTRIRTWFFFRLRNIFLKIFRNECKKNQEIWSKKFFMLRFLFLENSIHFSTFYEIKNSPKKTVYIFFFWIYFSVIFCFVFLESCADPFHLVCRSGSYRNLGGKKIVVIFYHKNSQI